MASESFIQLYVQKDDLWVIVSILSLTMTWVSSCLEHPDPLRQGKYSVHFIKNFLKKWVEIMIYDLFNMLLDSVC